MGRKCNVEGCLSDSNRPEDTGVTFHKIPLHPDIRPKWFSLCHIPDEKKSLKVIYVCSRHFLRADFCNFKGKKYMLRQGVLPSVFPWDKSKLEAIKAIKKEPDTEAQVKSEIEEDLEKIKEEILDKDEDGEIAIKQENISDSEIKVEQSDNDDKKDSVKLKPSTSGINFAINSKLEALDFNNIWYPARIVELDEEENEVLIHFEKFSSKYDEWICRDSPRLRPMQASGKKSVKIENYTIGERCLASWSDARKFPATVTKVLENDTYEVLFDDGFVKTLKAHRMSKSQGKHMQSSPLFDPIQSSKQERRDKKRKLNVAALFNKRPRVGSTEEKCKLETEDDSWTPKWKNGRPIGTDSVIDTNDGQRNSIVVADPRLPTGWVKHLIQRIHGTSAGKWDTVILSPDMRRFRTKSEIKIYMENHPELNLQESQFDFSLHRQRPRKKPEAEGTPPPAPPMLEPEPIIEPEEPIKEENPNALKILFVDNAYKCPIEGCGKNFRKENLAQMHVKHYHKEYTKFLDSTPNVADLAYARTVGENLERSPVAQKATPVRTAVKTTPKVAKTPLAESDTKCQSPIPTPSKAKDAEIIKLLSKPFDKKEQETIQPLPSGLPSNMYPDIKLKDLLTKSEAMPKRDDINLSTLCSSRPPVGIKTLLPVRHADNKLEDSSPKTLAKRKRTVLENTDITKGKENPPLITPLATDGITPTPLSPTSQHETHLPQPPNDIIIEGGEVIKIVRMKQEEIINCTCGFTEEDGLMIQCELCLCWQHAYCNNIERESQVPEKYVCYICQNPLRERSSKKYIHDQDWLKQGTLATASYHSKDEEVLQKRFEKLKGSHDVSGALVELKEFHHSLAVKLKIAESKNHPKLYLWSKPWEKLPLPEKVHVKEESQPEENTKNEGLDHEYIKTELEEKSDDQNDSMLMMILKAGKEDLNSLMDNQSGPIIPKPEAAIDSADCRLNLLDHIKHSYSLIEERLDDFEKKIDALEEGLNIDNEENYPRTRQTLQMLMRDLDTLKDFSQITTI